MSMVRHLLVVFALLLLKVDGSLLSFLFGGDTDDNLSVFDPRPFKMQNFKEGVEVEDRSVENLPKVRVGGRVMDLVHGGHFNDILQDAPDDIRPGSAVFFYDSSDRACMQRYNQMDWDAIAETQAPGRARLFAARYDMHAAPLRPWFKFTPELDLKTRFGISRCPELVYAPRSCHGFTEWCSRGKRDGIEYVGCKDFIESCINVRSWNGKGDIVSWLETNIHSEPEPKIIPGLKTYKSQSQWLRTRDDTTTNTAMRSLYLSRAFPAFSPSGFKAIPIPDELKTNLMGFYNRFNHTRRTEYWDTSLTQMNFHETRTTFIDLDQIYDERNKWANKFIKPLVEEWSGVSPLELTAFYGIREYHEGSWLRNHVDRIDTHVLSVTIALHKEPEGAPAWPLEVIQWSGDHVRYEHPAGSMILYESSKLNHGRPYRNKGGTHVGCFCHFKPAAMHGKDATEWEKITRDARNTQYTHQENYRWKEMKAVEPEHPHYAAFDYSKSFEEPGKAGASDDGRFSVTFKNEGEATYDLVWIGDETVLQATLDPMARMDIQTFEGHRFGWTARGSSDPLPGSIVTMNRDVLIHKFYGPEGKHQRSNSGKWTKFVKDKMEMDEL